MIRSRVKGKKLVKEISNMRLLSKISTTEEVAQVALFLSPNQASSITGAVINVDCEISGGLHDPV